MHEGIDWERYDTIVVGAPVIYGNVRQARCCEFVAAHRTELEARSNSFFNVSVVARTPAKATVSGNRYMQKFLQISPWRPRDLKVIAGKVDYPAWPWYAVLMIQLIMKTDAGPDESQCRHRLHELGRSCRLRAPGARAVKFLLLHQGVYGHTQRISEYLQDSLRKQGHEAIVLRAGRSRAGPRTLRRDRDRR